MNRVSDTKNNQGILMVMRSVQPTLKQTLDLVLVLDQIRDPGNLGTLLRSAAALGVQAVLLTIGSTDAFAPKVLRAGMGAHFKMEILTMGPKEIQAFCKQSNQKELEILLADSSEGGVCWDEDLTKPLCLVIGSEAEGAKADLRQIIDASVRIPMSGHTESYNAAVAGSILLYETYRQRKTL
jgi:TrmH family RNA methyltransferase